MESIVGKHRGGENRVVRASEDIFPSVGQRGDIRSSTTKEHHNQSSTNPYCLATMSSGCCGTKKQKTAGSPSSPSSNGVDGEGCSSSNNHSSAHPVHQLNGYHNGSVAHPEMGFYCFVSLLEFKKSFLIF